MNLSRRLEALERARDAGPAGGVRVQLPRNGREVPGDSVVEIYDPPQPAPPHPAPRT